MEPSKIVFTIELPTPATNMMVMLSGDTEALKRGPEILAGIAQAISATVAKLLNQPMEDVRSRLFNSAAFFLEKQDYSVVYNNQTDPLQ